MSREREIEDRIEAGEASAADAAELLFLLRQERMALAAVSWPENRDPKAARTCTRDELYERVMHLGALASAVDEYLRGPQPLQTEADAREVLRRAAWGDT